MNLSIVKSIHKTIILIVISIWCFFVTWFTQNSTFEQKASYVWINLDQIKQQPTISRYDVTRLLNAVECHDCIVTSEQFKSEYDISFWNKFSVLPWKDFDDIEYKQAIYKWESYYYCVASVWDKEYMYGYPLLTSPLCSWDFCGTNNITRWEFIQVVINIASEYIKNNYTANWKTINQWVSKQKSWSYIYNIFNNEDRENIKNNTNECENNECTIEDRKSFRTYLKYCMFNTKECNMKEFWWIKQWYWPIAELNIAIQENLLSENTFFINNIHKPIDWKTAVETFWKLFEKISCNFNGDYDCDWMLNTIDNCPNHYNPTQQDMDKDTIWNVCDNDIDWDWIQNSIGIIDERWSINANLRTDRTDNCILIKNTNQSDTNKNWIGDLCDNDIEWVSIGIRILWTWDNRRINAYVITDYTNTESSRKRIINNNEFIGKQVYYPIDQSGLYEFYVESLLDPKRKASAKSIIQRDKIYGSASIETVFSKPYLPIIIENTLQWEWWNEIERSLEGWIQSQQQITNNNKNSFIIRNPWTYTLSAIRKNNKQETIAIAKSIFTIQETNNNFQNITINNTRANIWDIITLTTQDEIKERKINRWDNKTTTTTKNTINHIYTDPWTYIITSIITLSNNTSREDYKTIIIENTSNKLKDKVLNITYDKLKNLPNEEIWYTNSRVWYNENEIQNELFLYSISNNKFGTINTSLSYPEFGIYYPQKQEVLWLCQVVSQQSTVVIKDSRMSCLDMKLKNISPQCDYDQDKIDDRCDDDIDWDWVKNAIWLITENHSSCNLLEAVIDKDKLPEHFLSCSLDNCPIHVNPNQTDENNDKHGDQCDNFNYIFSNPILPNNEIKDQDWDWISDDKDKCPTLKESYNWFEDNDWCPELWDNNPCKTAVLWDSTIWYECFQCPCQYAQEVSDLIPWDKIRSNLWDISGKILQSRSNEKTL